MRYVAIALLLFARVAIADEACDSGRNARCAQIEAFDQFQRADAELNRVYRQAITALKNEHKGRLRTEQREWIDRVRDDSCSKRIEEEWQGSCPTTWCVIAEQECQTEETLKRTKQLRKLVGEKK